MTGLRSGLTWVGMLKTPEGFTLKAGCLLPLWSLNTTAFAGVASGCVTVCASKLLDIQSAMSSLSRTLQGTNTR